MGLLKKIAAKCSVRPLPLTVIPLFLAVMCSSAYDSLLSFDVHFSLSFLFRTLVFFVLLFIVFSGFIYAIKQMNCNEKLASLRMVQRFEGLFYSQKRWLFIAFIMLICWLPYLFLMYPGNLSNDTTGQLAMFYSMMDSGSYAMSDHHPFFDTIVFGFIVYAVDAIVGSAHFGIFVCILLQCCATAAVFAYAIKTAVTRWGTSSFLGMAAVCFFALCPLIPLIVCSLSKDTFFSWVFILWFVILADLLLTDFERMKNKKFLVGLIFISLLVVLTKKLGIYIVVPSFLIITLLAKTTRINRALLCVPMVCAVITMGLVMPKVLDTFDVAPGEEKEMYSVPFQQTALTYVRFGDELPANEVEVVDRILDVSTLADRYDPGIADPVKGYAHPPFDGYTSVYIAEGIRYPGTYLDAAIAHVSYLFSNTHVKCIFDSLHNSWNKGFLPQSVFEKNAFCANASKSVEELYYWISDIPILEVLFVQGTYTVFVPAVLAIVVLSVSNRSRRNEVCLAIPICVSLVGLVLSPTLSSNVETMRYLIPFIYSAPLLVCIVSALLASRKTKNN